MMADNSEYGKNFGTPLTLLKMVHSGRDRSRLVEMVNDGRDGSCLVEMVHVASDGSRW